MWKWRVRPDESSARRGPSQAVFHPDLTKRNLGGVTKVQNLGGLCGTGIHRFGQRASGVKGVTGPSYEVVEIYEKVAMFGPGLFPTDVCKPGDDCMVVTGDRFKPKDPDILLTF
jgi:hypothetical protein